MKTKRHSKGWFLSILLICGPTLRADPAAERLPLVPYPQKVEIHEGSFIPNTHVILRHDEGIDEIGPIAETCAQDLVGIGFTVSHGKTPSEKDACIVTLSLHEDRDLGKEGYRLEVGSTLSITAATGNGLFWGTRTLLQLLHAGPRAGVPHLTIVDKPEFAYRGLMIDNARNFHSIDFHIATIRKLASIKLNRYQIHFSDRQSYTLPSTAFPDLPTAGRHYTLEDIGKVVDAAQRYHVMIVPEIDVPGHASALLLGIKDLGCGSGGGKICIGKEESYQVLGKLVSEVMEMIPGAYWHLGADEVSYDGAKCEHCAARMKSENIASGDQLFHYFINRMDGLVQGKGRQMLVWEGFSPNLEPAVRKDVIVCPFDVKHGGKMPDDYFKAGYQVLNTSWSPMYVADKICMCTPEDIARWSPNMFGAGRSPQPFAYWKKFRPDAYRGKVLGAQTCSWEIEEKAEDGLLFGDGPGFPEYGRPGKRVPIMAERVWTGSGTTAKDLLERVGESYWK